MYLPASFMQQKKALAIHKIYIYFPGSTALQLFPRYQLGVLLSVIAPKYEKEKT